MRKFYGVVKPILNLLLLKDIPVSHGLANIILALTTRLIPTVFRRPPFFCALIQPKGVSGQAVNGPGVFSR